MSCLDLFDDFEDAIHSSVVQNHDQQNQASDLFDQSFDIEFGDLLSAKDSSDTHGPSDSVLETPKQFVGRRKGGKGRGKSKSSAGKSKSNSAESSWAQKRSLRWLSGPVGSTESEKGADDNTGYPILSKMNLNEAFEQESIKKTDEIAASLFSSDVIRGAAKHSAHHFGVTEYFLRKLETRLAAFGLKAQDASCDAVIKKMCQVCEDYSESSVQGQLRLSPQLFLRIRQYDETPIKLRVATQTETSSEAFAISSVGEPPGPGPLPFLQQTVEYDVQTAKLFLTEQRWAALFSARIHPDSDDGQLKTFHLEGNLSTPLQALQNNSAEVMAGALNATVTKPWDTVVNEKFKRVCSVVTTDDLGANRACERILDELDSQRFPTATWTHTQTRLCQGLTIYASGWLKVS